MTKLGRALEAYYKESLEPTDFKSRIAAKMKDVPAEQVSNKHRLALRKLLTRPSYYPPSSKKGKK